MGFRYEIHPAIGVARVGNSPHRYYLAPDSIGGLPTEADSAGRERPVRQFKDGEGRIKRQAARFRVYRYDDANPSAAPQEVTLASPDVQAMTWSAHLANKKAAWWNFQPHIGDIMISPENTYANAAKGPMQITLRNESATTLDQRRGLIIDPGPRTVAGRHAHAAFTAKSAGDYRFVSFPPSTVSQGWPIRTLGELRTDGEGRLLVLGGHGLAGGDQSITSFAGADSWNDDIADGPVTCSLTLQDGTALQLQAWVVVGSPKFAPELVNIVTLDDIAFDVAVRFQNLIPELCQRDPQTASPFTPGRFNPNYIANYQRDIEPIIRRPLDYIWVANVPSMLAFAAPAFDPRDRTRKNLKARREFVSYFRQPGTPVWTDPKLADDPGEQAKANLPINQLWATDKQDNRLLPLMPMNSGSNSVRNWYIDKFCTLTETQYFLLQQWAEGKFTTEAAPALPGVHPLDQASVGNCVGSPMCPGIEVTWSLRNPNLYAGPYRIRHRYPESHYAAVGLDPSYDETLKPEGCEPGDLTKRMAIPWQADFFNCTAQFVNFTDSAINKGVESGIPVPPTYYAYWWPPQSPMYTIPNPLSVDAQRLEGIPAGLQAYYQRGIASYPETIMGWYYLPFLLNTNTRPGGRNYPYVVEAERQEDAFDVVTVAVGDVSNFVNPQDAAFWPAWYMKDAAKGGTPGAAASGGKLKAAAIPAAVANSGVDPEVYAAIVSGKRLQAPKRDLGR